MSIDDFGGRKFVFAMFVIFLAFLILISGNITFDQFIDTVVWVFGIFAGTNAVSHLSDGGTITVDHKVVNNLREDLKNNSDQIQ